MANDTVAEPHARQSDPPDPGFTPKRLLFALLFAAAVALAYLLRTVLAPLFFAFIVAYILDPLVDFFERFKVPRALGALFVLLGLAAVFTLLLVYAIPVFVEEIRSAGAMLPGQLKGLEARFEAWLWASYKLKVPHTATEFMRTFGDRIQSEIPDVLNTGVKAVFGTLTYVAVALSALIVPVFALYMLVDFDRITHRAQELIPRRWVGPITDIVLQIHRTLKGYVRGQLTANLILAALYATGLRVVDIRLAVPIGALTGMLAFVPYIGFATGLVLALAMATLDWQGPGHLVGVLSVMGGVQLLDALVITPRIVGGSVGLKPLEVLIAMMAAAALFGFAGVLLAVPIGAVAKILVRRAIKTYTASRFYAQPPEPHDTPRST